VPVALSGEDGFEENDAQGSASVLSGATNPFLGFVNAWTEYPNGVYEDDYYTVVLP